ncbi:hypothetical protein ON058_07585 [Demequina sp. B12]|uniref:hypothetical protein n=1 Tax=Demequina sp. B12 TaxID=2992757 RepID=UPI00237B7A3D|nr:hypothetical protein [Demequina sp. B12]MDE0573273.1 hypothetical protein [Demequina sp. B12]
MTATIRIVRPARAGAASTSRTSAMGQVSGKEADMMSMRVYIVAMTPRGPIVTDGEGSGVWRLDDHATTAVASAMTDGITTVEILADGRASIAGTEFSFSA